MNVDKICEVINNGGLVISPTDTVYGIMGDACCEEVIKKVYEVKHRSYSKPLILLVSNYDMFMKYTSDISDLEWSIIKKFMPGEVTIILKKSDKVSSLITAGSDYVGIRIPNNKDLLNIISELDRPVISTSANISGSDVITCVDMIEEELKEKIDYIEDGGDIVSRSSIVIRVVDGELEILREGVLSDDIRNYFNSL